MISADVVRAVGEHPLLSNAFTLSDYIAVILSGWSPNGWLTCGHAVRMALQIGESDSQYISVETEADFC